MKGRQLPRAGMLGGMFTQTTGRHDSSRKHDGATSNLRRAERSIVGEHAPNYQQPIAFSRAWHAKTKCSSYPQEHGVPRTPQPSLEIH